MALSKFLDPKNDIAFKKIFGTEKNKNILMHFLNDILRLSEDKKITEVTFLSPIQDPDILAKKQSIVDVLCEDKNGVKYIVEMQVAKTKGFEKRAQYYAAKAYSQQVNQGEQYHKLKEIIFIAIADCVIFPDKEDYISHHVILDRDTGAHDLKDFYFTFIELPKFPKEAPEQLTSILEKWCYFFRHAQETGPETLDKIIGTDLIIRQAYHELDRFYWTENELLNYEQELKRVRDAQAILEQKLDDAREEGMQKGIEKGIEKGREEGMQKGIEKGREEGMQKGIEKGREEGKQKGIQKVAINLLKQGYPLQKVKMCTGLSEEILNELADSLKKDE